MPDDKLKADIGQLGLPVVVAEHRDIERDGMAEWLEASGTCVVELGSEPGSARIRQPTNGMPWSTTREKAPGVMIEMLTSGTTGTPKRIALTTEGFNRSFASAMNYEKGRSIDDVPQLRDGTRLLTNPIAHIGGLWGAVSALAGGWRVCLLEKFSVEAWRGAVVRHRPDVAAAVPAALRMLLDADVPKEDLVSLKAIRTGTAPLDPAIVEAFLDRYDIPVLQTYGATEFAGAVAGWTLKDFRTRYREKVGSVGRLQRGVSARTVDPLTRAPLATGCEGLLELRSAQLGNDAWVTTTDRAIVDDEGFLWIKGRVDNAIIRGGFKIHPDEVISALERHPAVREASVVGVPDARLGEVPVAAVICRDAIAAPSSEDLAGYLRSVLTPYQIPVSFLVVDELPRTTSMKPDLTAVRRLFEQPDLSDIERG
jgi:acyl-coenzyme A synthetase/AMP-(fatty) acid ligase